MKEVKLLMRWKRRLELLHFRYILQRFFILMKITLNQFQYRAEMLGSVRQQQSRLAKLRGELQKANRGVNRAPEGARERAGGGQSGPPDQYRQQVLAGTRVLERTGDSLARAQQVVVGG